MAQKSTPTAWVGWVYFAAALLVAVGGMQIISGLAGLFHKSYFLVTSAGLVAFNYTTWGWISLILGALALLTGIGLWAGALWARMVAIFLVVLMMLDNLAFMNAYPIWSIVALVVNGFILYALTMHGDEAGAE